MVDKMNLSPSNRSHRTHRKSCAFDPWLKQIGRPAVDMVSCQSQRLMQEQDKYLDRATADRLMTDGGWYY
ncbi:hypothetical protein C5167_012496 [Papaver somniferum]|uniref:Uncharacterized protein n=1 Tax=Papaver somniferum TaxID=3469 RepID=A0A4Y7J1K3_PAPSO|nr:hypothetical protein C5167_012496 [Papaver somniferum]